MTLPTLPPAAKLSPCSHLADTVQLFISSCITSQECQTDTLDLTPYGASGVCLLEGHGTSFITYLFVSVRQATLAGNRCSQSKANSTGNHNQYKNCSFYFSAEKISNPVLLEAFTSPQKCGNITFFYY